MSTCNQDLLFANLLSFESGDAGDPRHEVENVGVDARFVPLGASGAPGHHAHHGDATIDLLHQRTAAVALASIHATRQEASAKHALVLTSRKNETVFYAV